MHALSKVKAKIINKISRTANGFQSETKKLLTSAHKPNTWHGACISRGTSKYVGDLEYILEYNHELALYIWKYKQPTVL